VVCFII